MTDERRTTPAEAAAATAATAGKTQLDDEPRQVVELSHEECYELLASQSIGRLAVSTPEGPPLVVPVNFHLDGEAIVFRSGAGLKLRLLRRTPVSFQVDWVDGFRHTGWSVLVQGVAYEATHWETDHIDLRPWAAGEKRTWIRIVPSSVSGRWLRATDLGSAVDERG